MGTPLTGAGSALVRPSRTHATRPGEGLRTVVVAPFTSGHARRLVFCLTAVGWAVVSLPGLWVLAVDAIWFAVGSGGDEPPALAAVLAVVTVVVVVVLSVVAGVADRLGSLQRGLAGALLGRPVSAPRTGGRARARLRDLAGWRAVGYVQLKLPVALIQLYAVALWVVGLVNLSYPLWWGLFRNDPPGARPSPVPVYTPFGFFGDGTFGVTTLPGAFAASAVGAAMLLVAPWLTRAVVATDLWLVRGLLGPGRRDARIHDLEQSRALAVEDSAAVLRRVERDLHDGAQIRLATLAMNLGMARHKLGHGAEEPDTEAARELVDSALRGAKDAIAELRLLARGLHPPVLDNGLPDALASLTAASVVPIDLDVDVATRPTPAIETIAYFCVAELLTNAVKHSSASTINVRVEGRVDSLRLAVGDDGVGGADPSRGTGLAGLAQRIAVVDGDLAVTSPVGGPTTITVRLPVRA